MADILAQPVTLIVGAAFIATVGAYFTFSSNNPATKAVPASKKKPALPKKVKKKKEKEAAAVNAPTPDSNGSTHSEKEVALDLNEFVGHFPDTDDEETAKAETSRKRAAKKKAAAKKKKEQGISSSSSKKSDNDTNSESEMARKVKKATPQDDGWETVAYKKRPSKTNL